MGDRLPGGAAERRVDQQAPGRGLAGRRIAELGRGLPGELLEIGARRAGDPGRAGCRDAVEHPLRIGEPAAQLDGLQPGLGREGERGRVATNRSYARAPRSGRRAARRARRAGPGASPRTAMDRMIGGAFGGGEAGFGVVERPGLAGGEAGDQPQLGHLAGEPASPLFEYLASSLQVSGA